MENTAKKSIAALMSSVALFLTVTTTSSCGVSQREQEEAARAQEAAARAQEAAARAQAAAAKALEAAQQASMAASRAAAKVEDATRAINKAADRLEQIQRNRAPHPSSVNDSSSDEVKQ